MKTLKKNSKFAKNEVKTVKVAVRDVSATPRGMSAAPRGVSAALRGVSATPCSMLAVQDTPGAWGTLGGVLYMKNFYGLELLKNHF